MMVKHVDAAELRIIISAVLAAAADAVLVAQNLLKISAHMATALASLNVNSLAQRVVWRRGARGKTRSGGREGGGR
jgi:hypothetical protein